MLAGAARIDITPKMGIQLAGDIGRLRPTEEIRDPLYANVLILQDGDAKLCLLTLDLLATTNEWSDRIRQGVASRLDMPVEQVVVHAEQNHASPSLGHFFVGEECDLIADDLRWLRGGDDAYHQPCVDKVMQAAEDAAGAMQPVTLAAGRGIDGRVAFNRRFVLRDGTVKTHPPSCDPSILHCEGPADPEVGVMTLTSEGGDVIAALLHHTCHPTAGYPHRYVIGDWPGAWADLAVQHFGRQCVPLVINGCCGNICAYNHISPDARVDYRQMAAMLMETTRRILGTMQPMAAPTLASERSILSMPLRKLTQEEADNAKEMLAKHPSPLWIDEEKTRVEWDWVYAVTLLDLLARQTEDPNCDYEIQAFRIGDLALVTLMGEPFVEGQLEIKLRSPAPFTMVAHFCNGYVGYVPTKKAFAGGGYETRTSNGSKWQPDALETITARANQLTGMLFS